MARLNSLLSNQSQGNIMSRVNGNLSTTALELQSGVLQLLTGHDPGRGYVLTQVLEAAKKAHFWVGLIPDIGYDPTVPLIDRVSTPTLPLVPAYWTPAQLAHAEDLIKNYGIEHEKENVPLQLQVAPIGPVYAFANTNVKMNFITG